MCHSGFASVNV